MEEEALITELYEFCSDYESLFDLSTPWSADEYTYAAGPWLCVRIPRNENIPERIDRVPDVVALFRDAPPPPARGYIVQKVEVECIECDGCGGTGYWQKSPFFMECEDCEGEGKTPSMDGMHIGGVYFWKALIAKLARLPNCKIAPTGPDTPAWIKFDGGDGLIMPMKEPNR